MFIIGITQSEDVHKALGVRFEIFNTDQVNEFRKLDIDAITGAITSDEISIDSTH